MNSASTAVWAPRILSVLRFVAGLLYFEHGTSKLFAVPHNPAFDHLQLASLLGVAGILETVGGALLIIGLFTRPVAFILSGEMAVGYFMVHAPKAFFPAANGGDAAILFCFIFFYLVFAGGGEWALDAIWTRGSSASRAPA